MEEILRYENRSQLFDFLIQDYHAVIIEQEYDPQAFGNFFVTLIADNILLRYVNDRGYLTVRIASVFNKKRWYDLSFLQAALANQKQINEASQYDNSERIDHFNKFIRTDYEKLNELFSETNYADTSRKIDNGLREDFYRHFPT